MLQSNQIIRTPHLSQFEIFGLCLPARSGRERTEHDENAGCGCGCGPRHHRNADKGLSLYTQIVFSLCIFRKCSLCGVTRITLHTSSPHTSQLHTPRHITFSARPRSHLDSTFPQDTVCLCVGEERYSIMGGACYSSMHARSMEWCPKSPV